MEASLPVGNRLSRETEVEVDPTLEGQVVDGGQRLLQSANARHGQRPLALLEVLHHHILDLQPHKALVTRSVALHQGAADDHRWEGQARDMMPHLKLQKQGCMSGGCKTSP